MTCQKDFCPLHTRTRAHMDWPHTCVPLWLGINLEHEAFSPADMNPCVKRVLVRADA